MCKKSIREFIAFPYFFYYSGGYYPTGMNKKSITPPVNSIKNKIKTILIVDDDHDIVHAIETILKLENYKTDHAYSGTECLKYVRTKIPDLILLDYMLPDRSGKEVVTLIRQDENLASLPIILITAAHGIENICKDLPIQGWIEKPFELQDLLDMITKSQ